MDGASSSGDYLITDLSNYQEDETNSSSSSILSLSFLKTPEKRNDSESNQSQSDNNENISISKKRIKMEFRNSKGNPLSDNYITTSDGSSMFQNMTSIDNSNNKTINNVCIVY